MKKDALEFMKQNINELYTHYFTDDSSDWINEAYGDDAFSVFKEIPDFELCDQTEKLPGEIDFENIQKLYLAIKNLSESQAADERLWAGMCNKVFYDYLRRRWKYDEKDITDAEKDVSAILSRFYFNNGARGSYFRNSLAKYWWVGRLTYDENDDRDGFYALKVIGSSDLNSKITEIFYNNTFTSNPEILKAITEALGLFYEHKILIPEREVLRPTMQYLNAVGGALLLDALPKAEIKKITFDKINSLLKGKESVLGVFEEEDDENESDEEFMPESIPIPDEVPSLAFDFDVDEPVFVAKGDKVKVYIEDLNKENTFSIPKNEDKKDMPLVQALLLGKREGDNISIARHKYIVKEIIKPIL